MLQKRTAILLQFLRTIGGLFLFSFGTYMEIHANIGLDPWNALSTGISYHTPLSFGIAHTGISVLILVLDVLMREKIGYGTLFDAFLVGNFVDFFTWLDLVPMQTSLVSGIALMTAGMCLMAVGQYLYMAAGQCCGPRDSFLVGVGRRLSGLPIGMVNILILAAVLLGGFLLGAPVGIGTVIATFGTGIVMQIVFYIMHFEPRNVVHRSLLEVTGELLRPAV